MVTEDKWFLQFAEGSSHCFCNYCRHFRPTVTDWASILGRSNDIYGLGVCKKIEGTSCYFYSNCSYFEYSPLKNVFNIESLDFIEDWKNNKEISSQLWSDILDYKAEEYRKRFTERAIRRRKRK